MFRYAKKIYSMKGAERSLFIKTYFLSILYSLYVVFFSQRFIFKKLGKQGVESDLTLSYEQIIVALLIEKSMRRVVRFLPIKFKCFARALTARRMLKKRNIPSTIYFGVSKNSNSKLIAHAWLRSGNIIVTGKEEISRFTPILFFT